MINWNKILSFIFLWFLITGIPLLAIEIYVNQRVSDKIVLAAASAFLSILWVNNFREKKNG